MKFLSQKTLSRLSAPGVSCFTAMSPRSLGTLVQRTAPKFTADAVYPDGNIRKCDLTSYMDKYVLLLFYPLNFTFVCPSELLAFNKAYDDFRKRSCEIISVSVDSAYSHLAWRSTPIEKGGLGHVNFPMVADLSKSISKDFGVLNDAGTISLRGLFLIDKKGYVRHSLVNDLPIGRSVHEALRVLDALQEVESKGCLCPANWQQGQRTMEPTKQSMIDILTSAN